ncbi:MAG TPA: DMT family transporter [Mycobacteriales bacterium]|jgi:drug/metabolite transporter (DMT)-like permease|nr:DMT family transporter [Mycobacteriales bacterium]
MLSPLGILALALSFATALCYAAGYVLQYHEAHQAPDRLFLSPKLLLELARHRIWVAGIIVMFIGSGLQAAALAAGSLAVVEPILCASLLFALPLSAAWRRERLTRRDWTGALAVCVGLALLLGVGAPSVGRPTMPQSEWLLVTLAAWGAALICVAAGKRTSAQAPRAALIGAAAGILSGLQDALTHYTLHEMSVHGYFSQTLSWQLWVQVAAGIYSIALMQSAYKAGPLTAGLPMIAVGEPVVGMLIGVVALNEHLHASTAALTFESIGGVVMLAGTWSLCRSPLVLGRNHPSRLAHEAVQHLEAKLAPVKDAAEAALGAARRKPGVTRARYASLQAVTMFLFFRNR